MEQVREWQRLWQWLWVSVVGSSNAQLVRLVSSFAWHVAFESLRAMTASGHCRLVCRREGKIGATRIFSLALEFDLYILTVTV
jgi:hypothetical protein